MRLHDKMITDQTWIRPQANASKFVDQNNFGQHFINDKAGNYHERVEMSLRAMATKYDWDYERFRLSRKKVDPGNKRRFMKNVARMFKNPIGYFTWAAKSRKFYFPVTYAVFLIGFGMATFNLLNDSRSAVNHDNFYVAHGFEVPSNLLAKVKDHNFKQAAPVGGFFSLMYRNPSDKDLVINPMHIQAYRKYLDRMPDM